MSGTASIKGGFAGGMRGPKARDILFNKLPPDSGLKAATGPGRHSQDGWLPFLTPSHPLEGRWGECVRVRACTGVRKEGTREE